MYVHTANIHKQVNGVSINTAATLWTPASGRTVRLMAGEISSNIAGSVIFQDGNGTFVYQTPTLVPGQPFPFDLGDGIVCPGGANSALQAVLAGATLTGTLHGEEN